MLRPWAALVAVLLVLAGCANSTRSKEKVQAAILDRLQARSGLDLKSLDVTTTSVSFDKNMAYATVAFHPKGDPSVNSGMVMNYTLEQRDSKWVVVKVSNSQGNAVPGHGGQDSSKLPPGHPSLDQMPPGQPDLPPGHPALNGSDASPTPGHGGSGQKQ